MVSIMLITVQMQVINVYFNDHLYVVNLISVLHIYKYRLKYMTAVMKINIYIYIYIYGILNKKFNMFSCMHSPSLLMLL